MTSADFVPTMRRHLASLDLAQANVVAAHEDGLERIPTAARRRSSLVPPRRHRTFLPAERV